MLHMSAFCATRNYLTTARLSTIHTISRNEAEVKSYMLTVLTLPQPNQLTTFELKIPQACAVQAFDELKHTASSELLMRTSNASSADTRSCYDGKNMY
mmetsp:Transcript_69600/g.109878  ORF Transcript_69600/g.109878 Transcript_69600/m.109878 type:complete len:98 (+) Transcript_69600:198-491(+)